MTGLENDIWYLMCGLMAGMVLAFWFNPDIDFYREVWPVVAGLMIVWFVWRDILPGRKRK